MRYVKWLIVVLFLVSMGLWGAVKYQEWNQTDTHAPVFSVDPEVLSISVENVGAGLMQGVQAYDEEQGDITDQVIMGDLSSLNGDGTCYLTYVVFDNANHSTTYRRKIELTDYRPPYFELVAALVFQQGKTVAPLSYIRAFDVLEGEITDELALLDSNVNTSQAGEYSVQVQVSSSLGDTSGLTLPVHVLAPGQSTLKNDCPLLYVPCGTAWNAQDYTWAVSGQGDEELQVESSVDTSTPGVYEVHYWAGQQHTWTTVVVYE